MDTRPASLSPAFDRLALPVRPHRSRYLVRPHLLTSSISPPPMLLSP
jgi:hypothetical protein